MADLDSQYRDLKKKCEAVEKEFKNNLTDFVVDETDGDIYLVSSRIKSLPSVKRKMATRKEINELSDLDDFLGFRVVCHCMSDIKEVKAPLEQWLQRISEDEVVVKPVSNRGYNADHFYTKIDGQIVEIQLRTILRHAWAEQSRKYIYERAEGEQDILAQSVAGILESCESLWDLVKQKCDVEETVDLTDRVKHKVKELTEVETPGELTEVETPGELTEVETPGELTEVETPGELTDRPINELEKLVEEARIPQVEQILEEAYLSLKEEWEQGFAKLQKNDEAELFFEVMETKMLMFKIIGLFAIRYSNESILKKVLEYFPKIAQVSEGKSGLTAGISVAYGILHNTFYYLGIFSLEKKRKASLKILLNTKLSWVVRGTFDITNLWDMPPIFCPAVLRSADLTFNRLLTHYEDEMKDKEVHEIISLSEEDFITYANQYNLLFCLKAEQLKAEDENRHIWYYPNFGRYYSSRVIPLVERSKKDPDFQEFIQHAFNEEITKFNENANARIEQIIARGLGSGYFWDSIRTW